MKLLLSNYENVFKSNIKNLNLNKKAVEKFRNEGNKFALITGECFEDIKFEVKNFNIEYDYLICNDGLIVFDETGNVVVSYQLLKRDLNLLRNFCTCESVVDESKFYSSPEAKQDVLQVCIKFKRFFDTKGYEKYLKNFRPDLRYISKLNRLYVSNDVDIMSVISKLQNFENINPNDIYIIGNNDKEISHHYNEYRVSNLPIKLSIGNMPTIKNTEVHKLIKKIGK